MIDKSEIRCRFRRSVDSYDDNAHVQKEIVEKLYMLLEKYQQHRPSGVLEIGCGTGLFTRKLQQGLQPERLFINDLVEEMCVKTAGICQLDSSHCFVGDAETIQLDGIFDLIVSASTFQWFTNPAATFKKLADHLNSGSLMVFSTFGKDNLLELRPTAGSGLAYHTTEELEELLSPHFEILFTEESLHRLSFADPLLILQHLKKTGVNAANPTPSVWTKGRIRQFTQDYRSLFLSGGKYPLTYHPIYFVCRKK